MAMVHRWLKKMWFRAKGPLVSSLTKRLSLIELSMLQLEKRVGKRPFFVQVGANDGTMVDPFSLLAKYWNGLMIEPQPDVFRRLVERRGNCDKMQFLNVAIGKEEGEAVLYGLNLPGNRSTGLASFEKDVITKHLHNGFVDDIARELAITLPNDRQSLIKEIRTRVCPLSKVIQERGIDRIDALFIDVEGYELQVLESFPWDKMHPGLVIYEHIHLSATAKHSCSSLLREWGYALMEEGMDVLAIAGERIEAL